MQWHQSDRRPRRFAGFWGCVGLVSGALQWVGPRTGSQRRARDRVVHGALLRSLEYKAPGPRGRLVPRGLQFDLVQRLTLVGRCECLPD